MAAGNHWRLLVPALLLLIYAVQCAWFIRTQSLTYDEPIHILAGQDAWRNNRFQLWNDHPPLGRLLFALPVIESKWQLTVVEHPNGSVEVPRIIPNPVVVAVRTRAINALLGIGFGVLLWLAARRLWSEPAANFALALFVFSPSLIAHFSIVATDGIGALAIFATAYRLIRWRRNPGAAQTILMGLVLGLLLLAKFYTPPFFLLTLGLMLLTKRGGWELRPWRWNWGSAVAAALIAVVLLWAGYFFHTSHLTLRDGTLVATYPNRPSLVKQIAWPIRLNLWIPAGEYIDGLRSVKYHNHQGHDEFFAGEISRTGWRTYYPALIVLKWPTVVLALFVTTAVLAVKRKLRVPADFAVLAIYPALALGMAIMARIQIGERHILPAYPFVLLFAAGIWEWARGTQPGDAVPRNPGRRRIAVAVLLVALALNAADALRYAPGYLAYFNVFVPPNQAWKLATDSNLDWGQGLIALREYQQRHPGEAMHLAYFGSVKPELYGVQATPLEEGKRVSGTVVVSATELSGQYNSTGNLANRWVLQYPLKTVLDHCLFVFEVPKDGS